MKDLYDNQTDDLKTRVDILMSIDVIPVEYGTFSQQIHLMMWFFHFVTGIGFKWNCVM